MSMVNHRGHLRTFSYITSKVATDHHLVHILLLVTYHRDSRQEFAKVGGIFPILHIVFLLDASN